MILSIPVTSAIAATRSIGNNEQEICRIGILSTHAFFLSCPAPLLIYLFCSVAWEGVFGQEIAARVRYGRQHDPQLGSLGKTGRFHWAS